MNEIRIYSELNVLFDDFLLLTECVYRSSNGNIDFSLTKKEVDTARERCIQNVNSLLSCAKLLTDNDDTRQCAVGLYLYAVEEYGKAQLLKQL